MIETLLDKSAPWLAGDGPEADVAFCTIACLVRNLADFPYPAKCSEDESRAVQDRVLGVLDKRNLLTDGRFYSLQNLEIKEARFLLERRLITHELMRREGPRGVFVSDDQCLSVMVNEENHITIQAAASGLQLDEIWTRLNRADDIMAETLDYAFNEQLGYLTASLGQVGTGLRTTVVMHLSGMAMVNTLFEAEQRAHDQGYEIQGLYGESRESWGDLYCLSNRSTLGQSEEEIIFHLKHIASDILAQEKRARESVMANGRDALEDRVARAVGVTRTARLLELPEAISLLSSLRLGFATGLLTDCSMVDLNELLICSQDAHIELRAGHDCDELTLNAERAGLFRSRFS